MVDLILNKIRCTRIEKNLSQKELAYHLNITQSSYAKIEKGEIKLSLNNLITISEYLNINLSSLFDQVTSSSDLNSLNTVILEDKMKGLIDNYLVEIKKLIIEMNHTQKNKHHLQ